MSVSTLVLLGLALVWAIVLLPEALKRVSRARHGDSIRSFNRQLSSLQMPNTRNRGAGADVIDLRSRSRSRAGGGVRTGVQPRSPQQRTVGASAPVSPAVRRRRQEILAVLGSASMLSLLCSVAFGGAFLLLFVVAAALLVAYVVALYQVTNTAPAPVAGHHPAGVRSSQRVPDLSGVRVSPVNARRIAN